MTDIKPAPGLHHLRAVPIADQGLPDAAAEGRRRVVMQLRERGCDDVEDILTLAQYIELGVDEEDRS